MISTFSGTFVKSESKPFQRLENGLFSFGVISASVCVFDANDELTVGLLGKNPAEQSRANVTDVRDASRAGRVANPDW